MTDHIPFDRAFAPEYQLQVSVGEATAPDGITRLRLDGAGTLEAAQLREVVGAGDKERAQARAPEGGAERVAGKLPPEEAMRLLEQVSFAQWGRPFPQRPGIPDEAIVEVSFGRTGRGAASARLWLRDAEADAAIGPVLAQLRRHLGELSGGKVYL